MNKKLIVANWKSHKTKSEVEAWLELFINGYKNSDTTNFELGIAPSLLYFDLVSRKLNQAGLSEIKLVSQDVSQYPLGKYTGATAAAQLKSVGCEYVLIGHSERRRYFGETPQIIAQKIDQALENGLQPVVCVTEDQIEEQAAVLCQSAKDRCIVAFETLSAIGTGMGEDISAVRAATLKIQESFGPIKVMYGGSVSPHNVSEYLMITDGVLVATASLEVTEFLALIEKMSENKL